MKKGEDNSNLDILMDVKLKLSVELGKAQMTIKEVLGLSTGSVIELEKTADEPVELYANGTLIAKGEVVVMGENLGLKITEIVEQDRIKEV